MTCESKPNQGKDGEFSFLIRHETNKCVGPHLCREHMHLSDYDYLHLLSSDSVVSQFKWQTKFTLSFLKCMAVLFHQSCLSGLGLLQVWMYLGAKKSLQLTLCQENSVKWKCTMEAKYDKYYLNYYLTGYYFHPSIRPSILFWLSCEGYDSWDRLQPDMGGRQWRDKGYTCSYWG